MKHYRVTPVFPREPPSYYVLEYRQSWLTPWNELRYDTKTLTKQQALDRINGHKTMMHMHRLQESLRESTIREEKKRMKTFYM